MEYGQKVRSLAIALMVAATPAAANTQSPDETAKVLKRLPQMDNPARTEPNKVEGQQGDVRLESLNLAPPTPLKPYLAAIHMRHDIVTGACDTVLEIRGVPGRNPEVHVYARSLEHRLPNNGVKGSLLAPPKKESSSVHVYQIKNGKDTYEQMLNALLKMNVLTKEQHKLASDMAGKLNAGNGVDPNPAPN